jgi:hypothetical protein
MLGYIGTHVELKECLWEADMKSVSILFYMLKGSPAIEINTPDGDIAPFVYELFTKFDHETDLNDLSIFLKRIQRNTEPMRISVQELIDKYSDKTPAVHQLNKIFKLLDENEYFMIIVNHRPNYEEMYKNYSVLMKLNFPNFDIEKNLNEGIELFKDIWDNYTIHITRENSRMIVGEKERQKRICRFCGNSISTGAKFKMEAHAISEGIGNKTVILAEECDSCNEYFGKTIERDLLTYLSLYRTLFGILNKDNKIPTIKGKNFEYKNLGNRNISLQIIDDGTNTFPDDQSTPPNNLILKYNEKIIKQNIYKVLVKYALSVIDSSMLSKFKNTVLWLREKDNFKSNLPKIGVLASYEMFKDKPLLSVYIRKTENKNTPYAVAELHFTFLTFVYIIPLFSDDEKEFTSNDEYEHFWKFFKHYDLIKDFKFESFTDSIDREVQFVLNFVQKNNV